MTKKFLTSFSMRNEKTKYWELSEYVLAREECPTLEECSLHLYNSQTDSRIIRIKNRVFARVLDSLLIDINISRFGYEDEMHPIQIHLRKKMILHELLRYTPLRVTVGATILREVISTSKRYELFSILLDALYIKKWLGGMKEGFEYYKKIGSEIEFYEEAKMANQKANDLLIELNSYDVFNPNADPEQMESYMENTLKSLRSGYTKFKTKNILFTIYYFELALFHQRNQFKEGLALLEGTLEWLKNDKVVGRKFRIGTWYSQMAEFQALLGNYELALEQLRNSRKYFSESSMNVVVSKRSEINYIFQLGKYREAKDLIDELINKGTRVMGDFRRDILVYTKACCHFMLGEFKECSRIVSQKYVIMKDKLGWELNLRYLRIMTMIERGHPDEAMAMVESTSKFIERNRNNKMLTIRDRTICKLMQELAKEGFSFHSPSVQAYHYILLLMEKNKPHRWELLGTELVRPHNWAKNKYKQFTIASPKKRKGKKLV
ncbi:MAG: hypothetical protein HY064_08360 [Bacteroidetes bacterium]|nr:hypothetical protein [Bacteroidota bacterium]